MTIDFDAAVERIIRTPRPVLYFDTCILFDIVRMVHRGTPQLAKSLNRLLAASMSNPVGLYLTTDYLTRIEWTENRDGVAKEMENDLEKLRGRVADYEVCARELQVEAAVTSQIPRDLIPKLVALCGGILNSNGELERDGACLLAAVARVQESRRPAQDGTLKDSLHLEHFLELARRLRTAGFTLGIGFVSSDRAAFGKKNQRNVLHPDLEPEFSAANLHYFDTLDAAVGKLLLDK